MSSDYVPGQTDQPLSHPVWRLPRRDYFLLPAIFVATILILLLGGEVAARLIYVQDDAAEPCEYGPLGDFRYHPMCTSRTKVWEGPWITQHFNDCGYRTAESCAPRPPGSLRVVVMGSSTARGALVNYPDSFAAMASDVLSKRCGGLVDFQNMGTEASDVNTLDRRMAEALSLRPSAIVMTIGPFDLVHLQDLPRAAGQTTATEASTLRTMVNRLRESRLFLLMQYYLYRDPAFQIRAFLLNTDAADYVRAPLSPAWQQRSAALGDLLGRMTARSDGVPILLVYTPERAQVALARQPIDRSDIDPFVLGSTLRRIAAEHGVRFVDSTQAFADATDFQSLFYLTDGHPAVGGHAALARVVEQGLLTAPTFARCEAE